MELSPKVRKIFIAIIILLICGILFDMFGQGVQTEMKLVGETQEERKEKLPIIEFVPNPVYSVCTDETMLKKYDSMYFAMITKCVDLNGKDILDEKHVSFTEIDWMKEGTHEITYTVRDDFGQKIQETVEVVLTKPIDTGH